MRFAFAVFAVLADPGGVSAQVEAATWRVLMPPRLILPVQGPPKLAFTDINTANKAELESLPGVGSDQAEAIIRGRPYTHPDDLVRRRIIAQSLYERIKDRVIANGQRASSKPG